MGGKRAGGAARNPGVTGAAGATDEARMSGVACNPDVTGAASAQAAVGATDEARMPNVLDEVRLVFGLGEDGHLGVRELAFNATGLGLLFLCVLAMTLDSTAALPDEARSILGWVIAGVIVLALGVLSFAPRATYRPFENPALGVGLCAAHAVALLAFMFVSRADFVFGIALTCLCGLVGGVTLAGMIVCWARVYIRMYIPDAALCALIASAGALVVYVLVLRHLPWPAGYVTVALCPLASAFFLHDRMREEPALVDLDHVHSYHERRRLWPLYVYKVALPLFCVGVATVLFLTYAHRSLTLDLDALHFVGLVVIILVAAVIGWFAIYTIRVGVQSFTRFLAVVIPLITLCSAPFAPMPSQAFAAVGTNLFASTCLLVAFSWAFLASASLEYSYAAASTFSLGTAAFVLGGMVAQPLMRLLPNDSPLFVVLIGVLCFFMTFGFFNRPAPNLAQSTYDRSAVERAEQLADERKGGTGDASGDGVPGGPAAGTRPPCGEACANCALARGEGAGTAGEGDPGFAGAHPRKGRFIRRCEHVARMYMLSERETEVLILLAKGYSLNHIKDELVISEGTTKTHVSHVYKKLDVHSRHELIDLIESVPEE